MEHGGLHHATIGDLFWPAINFGLFLALLLKTAAPQIRNFFRERTERLRAGLEAGARARREAEELRETLSRDLADLPALRERLRADLRETAERERGVLLEAGRRAADRIRADARRQADQEILAARVTLRREIVEEAVRQAGLMLRAAIGAEDHQRFVREFVTSARGGL